MLIRQVVRTAASRTGRIVSRRGKRGQGAGERVLNANTAAARFHNGIAPPRQERNLREAERDYIGFASSMMLYLPMGFGSSRMPPSGSDTFGLPEVPFRPRRFDP